MGRGLLEWDIEEGENENHFQTWDQQEPQELQFIILTFLFLRFTKTRKQSDSWMSSSQRRFICYEAGGSQHYKRQIVVDAAVQHTNLSGLKYPALWMRGRSAADSSRLHAIAGIVFHQRKLLHPSYTSLPKAIGNQWLDSVGVQWPESFPWTS